MKHAWLYSSLPFEPGNSEGKVCSQKKKKRKWSQKGVGGGLLSEEEKVMSEERWERSTCLRKKKTGLERGMGKVYQKKKGVF